MNKKVKRFLGDCFTEGEPIKVFSIHFWVLKIIKWLIAFAIFFCVMYLWGCTPQVKTEYVKVNVPVKCEIAVPKKPDATKEYDPNELNLLILKYTRELEVALERCK